MLSSLFIPDNTVSNGYDLYLKINNTLNKTVQINYFALSKVKSFIFLKQKASLLLTFLYVL